MKYFTKTGIGVTSHSSSTSDFFEFDPWSSPKAHLQKSDADTTTAKHNNNVKTKNLIDIFQIALYYSVGYEMSLLKNKFFNLALVKKKTLWIHLESLVVIEMMDLIQQKFQKRFVWQACNLNLITTTNNNCSKCE